MGWSEWREQDDPYQPDSWSSGDLFSVSDEILPLNGYIRGEGNAADGTCVSMGDWECPFDYSGVLLPEAAAKARSNFVPTETSYSARAMYYTENSVSALCPPLKYSKTSRVAIGYTRRSRSVYQWVEDHPPEIFRNSPTIEYEHPTSRLEFVSRYSWSIVFMWSHVAYWPDCPRSAPTPQSVDFVLHFKVNGNDFTVPWTSVTLEAPIVDTTGWDVYSHGSDGGFSGMPTGFDFLQSIQDNGWLLEWETYLEGTKDGSIRVIDGQQSHSDIAILDFPEYMRWHRPRYRVRRDVLQVKCPDGVFRYVGGSDIPLHVKSPTGGIITYDNSGYSPLYVKLPDGSDFVAAYAAGGTAPTGGGATGTPTETSYSYMLNGVPSPYLSASMYFSERAVETGALEPGYNDLPVSYSYGTGAVISESPTLAENHFYLRATAASGTTSAFLSGLGNGLDYYFTVSAVDVAGNESMLSTPSGAKCMPTGPAALTPSNLYISLSGAYSGASGPNPLINWDGVLPAGRGISYGVFFATGDMVFHYSHDVGHSWYEIISNTNGERYYAFDTRYTMTTGGSITSAMSDYIAVCKGCTAPATPTGMVATAGDGQVDVQLFGQYSANIDHYNFYYETIPTGPWTGPMMYSYPYTNMTIPGLQNGQTYKFYATQVDKYGYQSAASPVVTASPTGLAGSVVPTGIQVVASGGDAIDISWDAILRPDLTYKVYYGTGPGTVNTYEPTLNIYSSFTGDNASKRVSAHVAGLDYATTYWLGVSSVVSGGSESLRSIYESATTDLLHPCAVTGVVASAADSTVILSWEPSTADDLSHYNLYAGYSYVVGEATYYVSEPPVIAQNYQYFYSIYKLKLDPAFATLSNLITGDYRLTATFTGGYRDSHPYCGVIFHPGDDPGWDPSGVDFDMPLYNSSVSGASGMDIFSNEWVSDPFPIPGPSVYFMFSPSGPTFPDPDGTYNGLKRADLLLTDLRIDKV